MKKRQAKPPKLRPLAARDRRRVGVHLAQLAALAETAYRESMIDSKHAFEDVERQLRATMGALQATIGTMDQACNVIRKIQGLVNSELQAHPLGEVPEDLLTIAKELLGKKE